MYSSLTYFAPIAVSSTTAKPNFKQAFLKLENVLTSKFEMKLGATLKTTLLGLDNKILFTYIN